MLVLSAGSWRSFFTLLCLCVLKTQGTQYVRLAEPSRWCSFGAKERSTRQLPCYHEANCFYTPDKAVILLERNKLRNISVDWPRANYNQNDTTGTSTACLSSFEISSQRRICFHRADKLVFFTPSISKSHYETLEWNAGIETETGPVNTFANEIILIPANSTGVLKEIFARRKDSLLCMGNFNLVLKQIAVYSALRYHWDFKEILPVIFF